jgi:energy-coupling factor transporter transmembrane protein EcfT
MLKFFLKWLVIFILIIFLLFSVSWDYHRQVLYDAIITIPIYFIIFILYFITAISDVISVYKSKKWLKLIPSAIGYVLVFISVVIFVLTIHFDKKANRFKAESFIEINIEEECDYYIEFKEDGTYIANHVFFITTYHNYGKYIRKGDFIFLDGDFNTKGVSPIMKIVTSINEKTNKPILKLIQVDKKGKQLKNKVEYKFIEI